MHTTLYSSVCIKSSQNFDLLLNTVISVIVDKERVTDQFHMVCEIKPHKRLLIAQTKWFWLRVKRIFTHWEPLSSFKGKRSSKIISYFLRNKIYGRYVSLHPRFPNTEVNRKTILFTLVLIPVACDCRSVSAVPGVTLPRSQTTKSCQRKPEYKLVTNTNKNILFFM